MGNISKIFAFVLLLFFIASLVAFPQNAKAPLAPYITLNSTEITETTVTLSWTSTRFLAGNFRSYTLYMFTGSNYKGHPFTPIWSTSNREETTTIVTNLSPSSEYYFYILESDFYGQADSSHPLEVQTKPNPTLSPSPSPILEISNAYNSSFDYPNGFGWFVGLLQETQTPNAILNLF